MTNTKHIAILKQPFFDMVLSGEKTIESRWGMHKVAPYNKVSVGAKILLKETGQGRNGNCNSKKGSVL